MQITDLRFGKNLSSLNREPKSVILGFCLDESWKSSVSIRNSYLDLIGNKALAPGNQTFGEYCHYSFLPAGFVEEAELPVEQVLSDATIIKYSDHWKITEDGTDIGKPAAILELETAKRFQTSSYEILGTKPYNRAKILMYLSKVESAREKDLSKLTGSSPIGIFYNCEKLEEIGLIDYDSCFEKGWAQYKWADKKGQPESVGQNKAVTRAVTNFMKENRGNWDYSSVSSKIGSNIRTVSTVLSGLERQGFVRKLNKFKVREKQSEAKIKDLGLEITETFLEPIYEASKPDTDRGYLRDFTEGLMPSIDDIIRVTASYFLISPPLNDVPKRVTESEIIKLIGEAGPKGLRPKNVKEKTGENWNSYMADMATRGLLEKERGGGAVFYTLPQT